MDRLLYNKARDELIRRIEYIKNKEGKRKKNHKKLRFIQFNELDIKE